MNNIESYFLAFNKISRNQEAGTLEINCKTITEYKLSTIEKLCQLLKANKYQPHQLNKLQYQKRIIENGH